MGPNANHLKVEHIQFWIEHEGVRALSLGSHRDISQRMNGHVRPARR